MISKTDMTIVGKSVQKSKPNDEHIIKYKTALDLVRDGVLIIDKKFMIIYANKSALNNLGFESLENESMYILMTYQSAKIHDKIDTNEKFHKSARNIPIVHHCGNITNELVTLQEDGNLYFFTIHFNCRPAQLKEKFTILDGENSFSDVSIDEEF